jgi:hypothetical protein
MTKTKESKVVQPKNDITSVPANEATTDKKPEPEVLSRFAAFLIGARFPSNTRGDPDESKGGH